jgi:tRNA pseudouridine38-40 synthase
MEPIRTRYFIQLSFKGTCYHGWQEQKNASTVQSEINKALSVVTHESIDVTGAGRTDTGVHASYYIAHFDSLHNQLHLNTKFLYQVNNILPFDIVIQKIYKVNPSAHARFDAISRTYEYRIILNKNPFLNDFACFFGKALNINLMNEASSLLMNYSDFESFCKLHSDNKTTICKVMQANWQMNNETLVFTIKADRFLRNMVRAIVGTILQVGTGKITIDDFKNIIEQKNRSLAGSSALAKGLYLTDIEYPETIFR